MKRANPFRESMNAIGALIFDRARRGDLDISVACRRLADATVITIIHTDGIMRYVFTDADVDAVLTPRQRAARDVTRGGGA